MPGIVGVVEPQAPERLEARARGMLSAMHHRPNYASDTRVFPGCALGKLSIGPEKAFAEGDGVTIAHWGEIHALPANVSTDEHLRVLYRQGGPRALAGLNGIYTVVLYDEAQRQLVVVNDRCGFKKFHYYQSGDLLLVASEYKSFVGQPGFNGAVDSEGVAQLMEVGYPLDDHTLFRDVKLLLPASILTFKDGQLRIETYWDYDFGEENGCTAESYVDEFAERLKTAVVRQARDNMCIQTSGGLDSRALIGAVEKHCPGIRVQGATVGDSYAHDVKFGRRMALSLGYEHTAVPVPTDVYERFLSLGVARTEGTISCVNFFVFSMDEWLTRSGAPALMNGFLGGCLTGAHLYPEVAEMNDEQAADWLVHKFYRAMFREEQRKRLYRPGVASDVRDTTARSVRTCFERRKDLSLLNRSDYVDLHQRQRRFQSSHIDFWSPVCAVLDPFADNELLDFELSVPPRVRMSRKHYVEMIRRHLPKVARIPKSSTGIPLLVSRPQEMLIRARMRFYYRVLPRLTFGRMGGGNLASPFDSNRRLRTASRGFLTGLLGRRDLLEDLFNMDEVTHILQEYLDGEDWNAGQVAMLMTFAEWRQQYSTAPAASLACSR